ncbi:hypothetical protein [Aliiglaciecola sp. M165]|uniref:hypothetical protein n=1 Tax=Aliiglaciecola sp. M165 TaxID=2593649 RepID=UPI00117DFC14|nr:hypothetical protein [Aliiglaciecola sp. M165]TRY30748.1 hypothetical protein FM019_12735 [Aliiglaciecola sp. M165]
MVDTLEQFFAQYSEAMDNADVQRLTSFSMKPMVFVSDETKTICHSLQDIDKVHQLLMSSLKQGGVVKHIPKIMQSMRLSDSVRFVKVRWVFCDGADQALFSCYCSYTMQVENGDTLKILISVLDDEQNIISDLMKQAQEKK